MPYRTYNSYKYFKDSNLNIRSCDSYFKPYYDSPYQMSLRKNTFKFTKSKPKISLPATNKYKSYFSLNNMHKTTDYISKSCRYNAQKPQLFPIERGCNNIAQNSPPQKLNISECNSSINYTRFKYKYQRNIYRSSVKKAVHTIHRLSNRMCLNFIKTGLCSSDSCTYKHDKSNLRICPRYLSQCCQLGEFNCPLAHVLDPCRIPQCEYFPDGLCTRSDCPYLHIIYPTNAPLCRHFLNGRCPLERKCLHRHVWRESRKLPVRLSIDSKIRSKPKLFLEESTMRTPLPVPPKGSLRNIHPAPSFIPFLLDTSGC